jgi:hypothetical protein
MASDAPPWTLWQQPIIPVAGEPVPESPATETIILETEGKVTTTSTTYQTIASWTVTATKSGILRCLELAASDYDHALFQITINSVVLVTDWALPSAWNGYFADCRLEAEVVVLLEGKSDDGTSVDLWGAIEGKEVG